MAGDGEAGDGSRVRVAVRVRPTNRADKGVGEACVAVDGNKITIDNGQRSSNFTYDFVFTKDQQDVYNNIGESMLQDAFSGYNTCIFAYGQTGSGKTYSLLGANDPNDEKNQGLLPRITKELFDLTEELMAEDPTLSVKIQVSFMEVYNEKVHDLLQFEGTNQKPDISKLGELKIKQKKKGFFVEDLSTHTVMGWSRVAKLISNGTDMRARAETDMNELSSRSHSIFTIYINQTHEPPNPSVPDKKSKINIVDLAGSERQSKTGIENDAKAVKEAEKINYSLLVLGRCLNACSDPKQKGHLPVRDSALTKILSDIFGGNTKTIMFATVSPSIVNHTESLSTLQYAYNAKKIKHKAKVNSVAKALEIKELQEQVRRLGQDLLEELEKSASQKETLDAQIDAINSEKNLLAEALGEMKIENENLRKALEQLQAENAALRSGAGIASGAAINMDPNARMDRSASVLSSHSQGFGSMGSPTQQLHPSASQQSMALGGSYDPNGINLQSPTQMGGTYANAHNLPQPMMMEDESGGLTARRPPIEEDDEEDEELKKQKLQEIQDILMKKLPLLNPSLTNHMGGSIPNTARGPGDESMANSMPNTARGGPGVLNGVAASNEIRSYIGHASAVYSCAFSPQGDRMLSASRDRTLKIWNVKSGNEILTLKGHHGFVLSCAFHPNGNDVVSASDDKTLKVWNATNGKKTLTLKGHNDKVYCCKYSSSGNEIASSSCDKTIKVWNAENGKKLATLRGHTSAVFCVAFANASDSPLLVSASDDKTLRLWNWKAGSGEEKMTFQGHTGTVWSCCFSPSDNRILSASMDGTVKLWDVETSFSVRTFRGHSAPVHHAIFAKGGEKIISASRDRTLKIWDTETGKVLSTLIGHANTVYHCCVHNNLILSCSSDDILKVWNLKV